MPQTDILIQRNITDKSLKNKNRRYKRLPATNDNRKTNETNSPTETHRKANGTSRRKEPQLSQAEKMDEWPDLNFDDWLDPPNYDPAPWTPCKWWRSTMTAITRNVDLAPEKLVKLRKKRWWQLQMELQNCDKDFLDITIKQTKAIEENIKWINSKKQELAIHKLCVEPTG